jgi:peptide/nickel transport system substrate-binding protein
MLEGKKLRRTGRLGVVGLVASMTVAMVAGGALAQSNTSSPSASGSASSSAQTTFTYAATGKPSGLNPMVGYTGTDYTFWATTYDLLINYSTKDFSPDFAHSITTSVDTSSDSMSFTYHLRPNMLWSDGQPFTAADVAWTLNYYKKNSVPNYSSDLGLMKSATATDPTTVVITSTRPTSIYSGKTVFMYEYILPEHIWGKYENDYKAALRDPDVPAVGSGPYVMAKYVKNQSVELDKNPNYWGTAVGLVPQVDRVVYRIFGNEDAEAAALQSGEIDFGYFTSGSILNTLKARGLNTIGAEVPSFGEIGINNGSAYETNTTGGFKQHGDGAHALTDVVVRQAIRRATDNTVLVDKALLGYGTPGISPVQPGATTGAWTPGPNDPDLSFNIAAANSMLDQAGYKMGPNGVRIDPVNNKPLEFRLFVRSSDQPSQDMVPFFQGWMQQIGIKIDLTLMDSDKLSNVILAGDYDLFEWGWYPNPDPNYILEIFTCKERPPGDGSYRNSDMYYCNPAYDALYEKQLDVTDPVVRADTVHEMQSILYRDEPYVVIWNDATLEAWSKQWTGFQAQPAAIGDMLAAYGPLSFISLHPVAGSTSGTGSSGGIPAWVWLAILAGIVVVLGGVMVSRRRTGSDEDQA